MTTGLRPTSFQHLQLNAGIFLKNFDATGLTTAAALKTALASAITAGTGVIGATRGGGSFQCKPSVRQIDADGMRYPVKGGMVNDLWTVKLSGTMLEITPQNFADALMCADVAATGQVTRITLRTAIKDSDYIPRLCWIGDTSRGLVMIELTNALNLAGASFVFTDKGEGTLPFEFQAHQETADDGAYAPCTIVFFEEG